MYLAHFDLNQKPFQISPDPNFLWLGETHKEALATLEYGLEDNRGFLLLAGDVGTGKTTLINELLDNIDENTLVAAIPDPGVESLDFYNFLMQAFHIDKTFTSKGDFLVHFIHFLHKSHADGKKVLIIIDEAQRLSHEMLEEIRQLSNIEKKDTKLLNVFLIGQHEIIDALNETRNRALLQRITTKYLLGPLKKQDVQEYIEFRLKKAGTEKKIFSAGAIRQVIASTGCYPRLINILCDHALLSAFVKGKKKVDAAIIKDCSKDLEIKAEKAEDEYRESWTTVFFRHPLFRIPLYSALILMVLVSALYLFYPPAADWLPRLPFMKSPAVQKVKPPSPVVTPQAKSQPVGTQPLSNSMANKPESSGAVTSDTLRNETKTVPAAPVKKTAPFQEKNFTIQFQVDSNEFSDDTYALLNQIVDLVRRYEGIVIRISGHTDSRGNYAYNKRLSEFRANVVKSYFVGQGVGTDRITVAGMGPDQPVADNNTLEGRRANRRVEIQLVASK